jgi:GNAT superfamily N-acetyltransferase
MEVRLAGVEDARGIASVTVRGWRAAYRGIVPDEVLDGLSVDEREALGRQWLADESGETFTVVATGPAGRVEGYCSVFAPSRDDDAGHDTAGMAATYVDPDCWRRGVGATLIRAAWAELRLRGDWRDVTLWVLRTNQPARSFYATFGFEPDGAAQVHERSGQEIIRMRAPFPMG